MWCTKKSIARKEKDTSTPWCFTLMDDPGSDLSNDKNLMIEGLSPAIKTVAKRCIPSVAVNKSTNKPNAIAIKSSNQPAMSKGNKIISKG